MLKVFLAAVAISLAFSSFPALAQQKSCEEFCRTNKVHRTGYGLGQYVYEQVCPGVRYEEKRQ